MFRELWRKKVLVVFLVALLILFPTASVRPVQAVTKTILLSVGIEKAADGYTIVGVTMENSSSSSESGGASSKIVSAVGITIPKTLEGITANTGRKVSLAHCNLIVLGETLSKENVAEILYYFLAKFEVSNNALLVWTDGSVEETLKISMANKSAAGGLLETISAHNQKYVFKRLLTLDKFYKDYLSGRDAVMNAVSLNEDEIYNTKQMAIFRDGVFVGLEKNLIVRATAIQAP